MRTRISASLAAFVAAAALPAAALAQVYPERVAVRTHHAEAYQRRDADRSEQTERSTKTLHIGETGELDISNIAGDITVTRGGGDVATVEVIKTARADSGEGARAMLQLVEVAIADRPGRGEVRTIYPRGEDRGRHRNLNVSVAFNVTAPAGAELTLHSISGDLSVTNIQGELSAQTVSGNVRLASVGRVTTAKSVSGTVAISDATMDGSLEATSISGDVVLKKLSARRLDVSSISGDVRMTDVQCDRLQAQSISGLIEYDGSLARGGRYDLKSHSGEVRLELSGNTGFELDASSFSGEVRSDFPITTHGTSGEGSRRRRTLSGTYGDGSAVLTLGSFSGGIVIARK
ncbi:MAG TPA: DUF4097 family beta strand repeat-containing protein [Vicinamibacterales bacterium]|nr:DUF4097 family beta strand repeat-containing protein [Vicinamibacterales bacterium]